MKTKSNMTVKQKPKELDWEKEFDWTMMNDETHSFDEQWHYLGNFISKILQEQREEIIEECLKGAKDDMTGLYDYDRIAENVINLMKK